MFVELRVDLLKLLLGLCLLTLGIFLSVSRIYVLFFFLQRPLKCLTWSFPPNFGFLLLLSWVIRGRRVVLNKLQYFDQQCLNLRVLVQKSIPISRVLNQTQKLHKQFLLWKVETLSTKFIDYMLKLDDVGLGVTSSDQHNISICFKVSSLRVANPTNRVRTISHNLSDLGIKVP